MVYFAPKDRSNTIKSHSQLSTLEDIQREIQAADRRCARLRNTATRLLETQAAKGCAGRSISRLGSPPPRLSPIIHGRHRPYSAVDSRALHGVRVPQGHGLQYGLVQGHRRLGFVVKRPRSWCCFRCLSLSQSHRRCCRSPFAPQRSDCTTRERICRD